jgi:hypothetical protein
VQINERKLFFPIAAFVLIVLISCISKIAAANPSEPNIAKPNLKMKIPAFNLDEHLALMNLSMEEAIKKFSIPKKDIDNNANYEKLSKLILLKNKKFHPGYFYFNDGKLVMLYIGKNDQLEKLDPKVLQDNLVEKGISLRSRAGKTFNHYVYPEKGVAFSADSRSVRFIELFPPTSLEAYKVEIYEDVPPFIK